MRTGHKNNLVFFTFVIIFTMTWLFLSSYFYYLYKMQSNNYILSQDTLMVQSQNIVLDTYEKFSNYIFEAIVDSEDVTSIMADTKGQDSADLKATREKLYANLKDVYEITKYYDFGEIHFHLPDGTSFLRFNSPSKYGDPLNDIRSSIRIANQELRFVKGFEIGRIFNGYRFVYPLYHEDEHVGSVEVSLSIATVMKVLNVNFPTRDTSFILRKDLVESTVFPDEQWRFVSSIIDDNYVVDQEVLNAIDDNIVYRKLYEDENFYKVLRSKVEDNLDKQVSFSFVLSYGGTSYLVQYIAINNIDDIMVGYLFSIGEDAHFENMQKSLAIQLVAATVMYLIIIFILVLVDRNRKKINNLALRDPLTKIFNRYSFFEYAHKEIARSDKNVSLTTFAMLDIDLFKHVNDTFGHGVGDHVLIKVVSLIKHSIRDTDVFARYGGEEFIIMMPNTDMIQARDIAERIRENVASHSFPKIGNLTISIGLSERIKSESIDESIDRADRALYEAKQGGRNRVCG